MDEFKGDKTVNVQMDLGHVAEFPTFEYVAWLEARVAGLERENANNLARVNELSKLSATMVFHTPSRRIPREYEEDYASYSDEDDDRRG